ncbi:hypothetical protein ACQZ4R_02000 [Agrobacterium vitis]|nr:MULTISPECIES: hypothetical protein [Rhizobium/Agrobacterium group]
MKVPTVQLDQLPVSPALNSAELQAPSLVLLPAVFSRPRKS